MYAKLAKELAHYAYRKSECERLKLDNKYAAYWKAKYYGFAHCVELVTGNHPTTILRNKNEVKVRIGDYEKVVTFD